MANETELGTRTVDPDMLFDALADADRRRVLAALLDAETRTVDDLARTLARANGQQTDRDPAEVSSDAVDHYRVRLHHVHLPRLADADLVRYSPSQNAVALTGPQASREAIAICVDGTEQ